MSIAFSNALSGLTADATAINVVSENLANLNTTGYKDEQVSFEDLVNQSLSGFSNATSISGSTIARTNQEFTQGTLQTTGGAFDAAIQGGGFFVLRDPSGQQLFTRQGNFQVTSTGEVMTSSGQHVEGWNAVNGVSEHERSHIRPRRADVAVVDPGGHDPVLSDGEPQCERNGGLAERHLQLAHPGLRRRRAMRTL